MEGIYNLYSYWIFRRFDGELQIVTSELRFRKGEQKGQSKWKRLIIRGGSLRSRLAGLPCFHLNNPVTDARINKNYS